MKYILLIFICVHRVILLLAQRNIKIRRFKNDGFFDGTSVHKDKLVNFRHQANKYYTSVYANPTDKLESFAMSICSLCSLFKVYVRQNANRNEISAPEL